MDRADFQRLREEAGRAGIGASETADACRLGWHGDNGPLALYARKATHAPMLPPTMRQQIGIVLEPYVALMYEKVTGVALQEPVEPIWRHPQIAWMFASPDRVTADGRLVELKTAGFAGEEWGEDGTDQVPDGYLVQVMQQLEVGLALGRCQPEADLAVLIGNSDFRVYHIQHRPDVVEHIVKFAGSLWDRIRVRRPPEPDWMAADTAKLLDLIHRPAEGKAVELGWDEMTPAMNYIQAGMEIRDLERERDQFKARLIAAMGDASTGILPDGRTITRKIVPAKTMSYERSEYTTFHIRQPRKGSNHGEEE